MTGATQVEEVLRADEQTATLRLQCGHVVESDDPSVSVGRLALCPVCAAGIPVPALPRGELSLAPATDAQLDALAASYAATMRARGVTIDKSAEAMIRRAAAVQDAWRVAFGKVFK